MNRFAVAVLAIVVGAGCGKSKAKCQADVDDLMTYLRTLDMEGSLFWVDEGTQLVLRPDAPRAKRFGPVVMMKGNEVAFQGMRITVTDEFRERLDASQKRIREDIAAGRVPKHETPEPELIYFQIDTGVAWSRVAEWVSAAADVGFTHPSFVFATPVATQPPPRTWVDDKLDKLKADRAASGGANMATGVADITRGIIESCHPLEKVYGRVGAVEGENKAVTIVEGTGPALVECGCDVDIPALRSVMYGIMGNPHPTGVVGVVLAKGGKPITAPPAATWGEVSKQIQQGDVVAFATK